MKLKGSKWIVAMLKSLYEQLKDTPTQEGSILVVDEDYIKSADDKV